MYIGDENNKREKKVMERKLKEQERIRKYRLERNDEKHKYDNEKDRQRKQRDKLRKKPILKQEKEVNLKRDIEYIYRESRTAQRVIDDKVKDRERKIISMGS